MTIGFREPGRDEVIPLPVSTHPEPPFVPGQHAFTAVALYEIKDPSRLPILLNMENIRAVLSPFCWWCRAVESDGSPCPGQPG